MKYRHAMILLATSLPVCIILRAIQMFFTIDEGTGFIKQQYSTISLLISVIICAAIASVALLAAIADIKCKESNGPQLAISVSSLIVGGMLIYKSVTNLSTIFKSIAWQNSLIKDVLTLLQSIAWYDFILMILMLLSAVVFFIYGLKSISDFKMPSMILVIPVLCFIVKLISVFVSTSALALVTENVFLIFTSSAVLWFMFEFSNFENGVGDPDKKVRKIFASGIASIMFCLVATIPKLYFAIFLKRGMSNADISTTLLDVSLAIFILSYIICKFGEFHKNKKAPSKHSA